MRMREREGMRNKYLHTLLSPLSIRSLHLSISSATEELSDPADVSEQFLSFPAKYTSSPTPMTKQTTRKNNKSPTRTEIKQPFLPFPGVSSASLLYLAMSEKSKDSALPIAKVINPMLSDVIRFYPTR